MSKVELSRMTWKEAEVALRGNPVILLPMGSFEQHGPTAPMGDYRYADELARRIAEGSRGNALSLPAIPWGNSEYFKSFPGTLSIRPDTLRAVVADLAECVFDHGCDHLMFVCGHAGNMPLLEEVGRDIRRRRGVRVATVSPLAWITPQLRAEVYGSEHPNTGHGSEPMQSLGMYLFPEDVRSDLIEPGNAPKWRGERVQGTSTVFVDGQPVHMYLNYEEITPNGVLGDPRLGSAEAGRRIVEHLVAVGVRMVDWFRGQDTKG